MMNLRIGRRTALLAAAALAVVSLPFVSAFADESKPAEKPPEEKKEPVLPKAPDFKLMDIDGKERTLAEFKDKWVVLEWTNYSCPFVVKHYKPGAMQALQAKYTAKGVVWLSICSSAEGKQGHLSPADWKKAVADAKASPTAVLLDADGATGLAYGAKTTPDMRVINGKGELVYSGAIDDDPSAKGDPAKASCYVSQVLDAVLEGKTPPVTSTKPYGCSVKYANPPAAPATK